MRGLVPSNELAVCNNMCRSIEVVHFDACSAHNNRNHDAILVSNRMNCSIIHSLMALGVRDTVQN